MPKRIMLRAVSSAEKQEIRRLAQARKEGVEVVRRAHLIKYLIKHPEVPASRAGMRVGFGSNASGAHWVKRFNAEGVEGLRDRPKSGRPPRHNQEKRSQVINLAVQKPSTLGYPFALWTLERLRVAIEERYGYRFSRSTIWKWLDDEGLQWKRQQSWFHEAEKHDPEFVEKRGPSSGPM
jgi:transposase